jgi:hypothetical protein
MKNLIPYNLFEMAKLNLVDIINDIEIVKNSLYYFNSRYNKIEIKGNTFDTEFKLWQDDRPTLEEFKKAVEDKDEESFCILSLKIIQKKQEVFKKIYDRYYLIIDSDFNLMIFYLIRKGTGVQMIFLQLIPIVFLKDREKLIKVMFNVIKDHNGSLNEMAKYDNDYIDNKIKDLLTIFKNHRRHNHTGNWYDINGTAISSFDPNDVSQLTNMHNELAELITFDVHRKNFITVTITLCFHRNGYFIFKQQIEDNYGDITSSTESKIIPINTDVEDVMDMFYKFLEKHR